MLTYRNIDDNINPALNKCRQLNNYVLIVTRRGIEVVITRRSWKPFVRKGAWVRIPPPALSFALKQRYKRKWKKFLTKRNRFDKISKLSQNDNTSVRKNWKRKIKKLLTNTWRCDNISELLKTTENIDNWTVNNLERFKTSEACQKKIIDFLPGFERSPRVKFKSSKDERTAFNKANLKNSKA